MCSDVRNLQTKSSEYIVICQDDLYIVSQTPEETLNMLQDKNKININLADKYPHGPGGTMICPLKKCPGELYVNVNILFKDKIPTDI